MELTDVISNRTVVLLDGAMGTQLAERGLPMGGETNISNPDTVLDVHRTYVASGCQLLITNTLTMNSIYIKNHRLDVDMRVVNVKGAEITRAAAGKNRFVLGDIGSTGKMIEPFGDLSESDAFAAYKAQASALKDGGVDGYIVETMIDLGEALCALRACKDTSDLPVIVSMAFSTVKDGGRTIMGNTARDCAEKLTESGASAVGANCGDLDPYEVAAVVSTIQKSTSLPVVAQPNAGKPKLIDDQTVFDMSPSDFARGLMACIDAGARIVGGCCGTSPAHITAAAGLLQQLDTEK